MTVWHISVGKHERMGFAIHRSPHTKYWKMLWIGYWQIYMWSDFSETWQWCLRNAFRI